MRGHDHVLDSLLTGFWDVLLGLGGGLACGFSLYLLTLAVASIGYKSATKSTAAPPSSRLIVLVPAHNEEQLIRTSVKSLLAQSYPSHLFRVVVVADNCTDETASVAQAVGAQVMIRDEPSALGKGRALRWAMDLVLAGSNPPDAVVVVDADSITESGLLSALEREFAAGHAVVQADYEVLLDPNSPRSTMIATGFLLFHKVRFAGRARLGMPANLVGNGMLLSRELLDVQPWDAFTGAEDLEYSVHLAMAGVRPRFAPSAVVLGPGPGTRKGELRQRLRWEGGRFYVVRKWLWTMVKSGLRRRDPLLLSSALDLATPPLAVLCIGSFCGASLTGVAVVLGLAPIWCMVPWFVALVSIPAYVVIGLRSGRAPAPMWRVVIRAPAFLVSKLAAYIRILRGFDPTRWDRTDRLGSTVKSLRRVKIAGVPVDPIDMAAALSRLTSAIGGSKVFQVATINLDFMVSAQSNRDIRRIYERSDLNLADGAPVVWLGRLLGAHMPGRVAGADLVPALIAETSRIGARIFLLGGEDGAARAAAERLQELYPDLIVAGTYEPKRATVQQMDNEEILYRICAARPDLLLVAFGHPKQEEWIDLHRERLPAGVVIGVGCVFDLLARRSRRAPRWMQNAGLEWVYRLIREPRRLTHRYLIDAAWLLPITVRTLLTRISARPMTDAA